MHKIKELFPIIAICLGLFMLLGVLLFFGVKSKERSQTSNPQITTYPTTQVLPTTPVVSKPTSFPTINLSDKKITIGEVKVNNFYLENEKTNVKNDVLISDKKSYQIVYLAPFQEFIIDILFSPFEENRQKAEKDFLTILGIDKEKACRLKIKISTSYRVNPQESNTIYPLSFCQQ